MVVEALLGTHSVHRHRIGLTAAAAIAKDGPIRVELRVAVPVGVARIEAPQVGTLLVVSGTLAHEAVALARGAREPVLFVQIGPTGGQAAVAMLGQVALAPRLPTQETARPQPAPVATGATDALSALPEPAGGLLAAGVIPAVWIRATVAVLALFHIAIAAGLRDGLFQLIGLVVQTIGGLVAQQGQVGLDAAAREPEWHIERQHVAARNWLALLEGPAVEELECVLVVS